ncbi:putative exoenzyme production regulatory peptide [Pectobacterium carotovorum subsp. carotovorum PCC21]|nr:putative exoenzyme production regulatory peptide [Pectobacterium carotovorum subsp. carotovorum PCC21]
MGQEPKGIESRKIQDGNVRKKVGRQQGLWVRTTKKEKFSRMSRDANV